MNWEALCPNSSVTAQISSLVPALQGPSREIPAALEDVPLMEAPSLQSNRKGQESTGQIQQITVLMADVTED